MANAKTAITATSVQVAKIVGKLLTTSDPILRDREFKKLDDVVRYRACRIRTVYSLSGFEAWEQGILGYENQIAALFSNEEFLALLRRPHRTALESSELEHRLFSKKCGPFRALLFDEKIVFVNPYVERSQTWSRLSFEQPLYHEGKASAHKSTFLKNSDHRKLCMAAFNNPIGRLVGCKQLILNFRFPEEIGQLSKGRGRTRIIRVHCDRVRRNTGSGYQTRIHGYPISDLELREDLAECPELETLLPA